MHSNEIFRSVELRFDETSFAVQMGYGWMKFPFFLVWIRGGGGSFRVEFQVLACANRRKLYCVIRIGYDQVEYFWGSDRVSGLVQMEPSSYNQEAYRWKHIILFYFAKIGLQLDIIFFSVGFGSG